MTSQRVEYWDAKWKANQSSWHIDGTNHFLVKYFNHITKIKNPARILVPLCGKAVDVKWMYDLGHSVVGIEGVEEPIIQFFTEQHLEYRKEMVGNCPCYSTEDGRIQIFHSDLFLIDAEVVGKFDGIWDRGSLVAIYQEDREKYAELMKKLLNESFAYVLITVAYDQSKFSGPPRSVPENEMNRLFGDFCDVNILEILTDPDGCNIVALLGRKNMKSSE